MVWRLVGSVIRNDYPSLRALEGKKVKSIADISMIRYEPTVFDKSKLQDQIRKGDLGFVGVTQVSGEIPLAFPISGLLPANLAHLSRRPMRVFHVFWATFSKQFEIEI